MKYLLGLMLLFSTSVQADLQRYFACGVFIGVVQIEDQLFDLNNMSEEEGYLVYLEVEKINGGESQYFDVDLKQLIPGLVCA